MNKTLNRRIWLTLAAVVLAAVAIGLGAYFTRPAARLAGDAWDYALPGDEVSGIWSLTQQGVLTPDDLAKSAQAGQPITASASLRNMTQLYYARFTPEPTSEYLDFTLQIVLYASVEDAAAALSAGAPAEAGWESLAVEQVGDEAHAWSYTSTDASAPQSVYRIDFRYLNGAASVAMIGTSEALPGLDEPLGYARQILDKMRERATPEEAVRLKKARLPDLRLLLLTQGEVAQQDTYLGERWMVDGSLLPQWTPTGHMSPAAREAVTRLGRVSGYQMYMLKQLDDSERRGTVAERLFQQVSAYSQADSAAAVLDLMIGLEQSPELEVPQVGDRARAWGGLMTLLGDAGQEAVVAQSEIDFQAGLYVGSIRLQSRPLAKSEAEAAQQQLQQLALQLARALAEKLQAAQP